MARTKGSKNKVKLSPSEEVITKENLIKDLGSFTCKDPTLVFLNLLR